MQTLIVNSSVLGDVMTNCYTVFNQDTRECIIIDPAGNARFLANSLTNQQLKCVAIFLTHGHIDHFGGLKPLLELIGNIPVYCAKEEEDVLQDPHMNLSPMICGEVVTCKPDVTLEDGQVVELLGTKIVCKLVPGHTKGGMCYYFEENGMLFSGDTLFCRSIGRSDFPTGDGIQLVKNIKEKLMVLPGETVVYPGHNERTTIEKEKAWNPFFEEF